MVKQRIVETDEGIQSEFEVQAYDQLARMLRDRGWMETEAIIKSGIKKGSALEISSGPGYLGLEWLKKTKGTKLQALDISKEMIRIAKKNTEEYAFSKRIEFIEGNAENLPQGDNIFDAVFTNRALHEWSEPKKVFNEIHRVLKQDGKFFISEL